MKFRGHFGELLLNINQILFILVQSYIGIIHCQEYERTIQEIAKKFGSQMLNIGYEKTCFNRISENFQKHRQEVKPIDGAKLMNDMRKDLIQMFAMKKKAVEKIAIETERLADKYAYDSKDELTTDYYNVKRIYDERYENITGQEAANFRPLDLSLHPNFEETKVNLQHSAIHVPINVYEQQPALQNDIKWTEPLRETFVDNLQQDRSLSWQFFCSGKGFLREYPAFRWKQPGYDLPDLYDCRMRQWYIQAAASPKDLIVLVDTSGSMTGLRRNIAQNVVFNILDTLTEDDYVQVLKFTNEIKYVGPCFDRLVQATKRNIREIKLQLEGFKTSDIANFTSAFMHAFKTLNDKKGAQCNQAVMLITDGAPEKYEHIFLKYNPGQKVRVFTYVIGREVTQIEEVFWMACNNRGFYAQVANFAEVREQVQQYIPVMSRPLALYAQRLIAWTPVYAPVAEIQLTDWVWEEKAKAIKMRLLKQLVQQLQLLRELRAKAQEKVIINGVIGGPNDTYELIDEEAEEEDMMEEMDDGSSSLLNKIYQEFRTKLEHSMVRQPERRKRIPLRVTLAAPVFNYRKYINITKKILVKNVYKDSPPIPIRIAQLHGVAGVDVPIREIEKTASSYQLGVNGYSFMLTNNGKVLYHPDFRPLFQDMLKPFYTTIDLTELEITTDTVKQRWIDPNILAIRDQMISGKQGQKRLRVKYHMDLMKRPVFKIHNYYYGKIDQTPFSYSVVLPEPYGLIRFKAQVDVKSESKRENFTRFFEGNNWRIHPDWVYCESPDKPSGLVPTTPEDVIREFLNYDLVNNSYVWRSKSSNPGGRNNSNDNSLAICDKDLLQSLLFDARVTHTFDECSKFSLQFNKQDQQTIDIVSAFVSTRSGLTRFKTVEENNDMYNKTENDIFSRSIDEVYYRRAVDYYFNDSKAFVYSLPFEAGLKDNVLVTASHAIFVGNGKSNAPVSVVGVQYNYSSFYSTFFRMTENLGLNCSSDEISCYVLDNNGFIIISEVYRDVGLFFGEIDNDFFQDMVQQGIYRKTIFYDYQAICIVITPYGNAAPKCLQTPFVYLRNIVHWFGMKFLTILSYFTSYRALFMLNTPTTMAFDYPDYEDPYEIKFNKSTPKPCDKVFDLYDLGSYSNRTRKYLYECKPEDCSRPYYIQNIPHSNLLILVMLKTCSCFQTSVRFEPREAEMSDNETCELIRKELFRVGPEHCFQQHEQESEIEYCGKAIPMHSQQTLLIIILTVVCGLTTTVFHTLYIEF